jgi:hypothetical protein
MCEFVNFTSAKIWVKICVCQKKVVTLRQNLAQKGEIYETKKRKNSFNRRTRTVFYQDMGG